MPYTEQNLNYYVFLTTFCIKPFIFMFLSHIGAIMDSCMQMQLFFISWLTMACRVISMLLPRTRNGNTYGTSVWYLTKYYQNPDSYTCKHHKNMIPQLRCFSVPVIIIYCYLACSQANCYSTCQHFLYCIATACYNF